jgi:transcriptional regulator with XRE-family HTH domain
MPLDPNKPERSCACNGNMVRYYREKQGMRQIDLAHISGYSVRLIGKAEAGKPIRIETIEDLADALSSDEFPLGSHDLISHPEQTAHSYFENLVDYESNRAWFEHFIDKHIAIRVLVSKLGTITELAYQGMGGFEKYRREFCKFFLKSTSGKNSRSRKICSLGNEVLIWHEKISCPAEQLSDEMSRVSVSPIDTYFVTTKLLFSSGRLRGLEDRIVANSSSPLLESLRDPRAMDAHAAPFPDFAARESSSHELSQTSCHNLGGSKK